MWLFPREPLLFTTGRSSFSRSCLPCYIYPFLYNNPASFFKRESCACVIVHLIQPKRRRVARSSSNRIECPVRRVQLRGARNESIV